MNNATTPMQVLNLPIEEIIPNRFQPRLSFDEDGLKELANSIKEHGIIQPLVVRKLADKYEIIAGERRYKAAKMAGLTEVPAIVTAMDDQKSAEAAIVENVQRRDLSAIEEAKSYQALLDKEELTQEQLAKKMGLSQSAISNKLRLLTLSEPVQNALIDGRISERHARSLLQIEDPFDQEEWLNKIIDERLTVRDLDKKIKESLNNNGGSEEVPLIESAPNLEAIKESATDIVNPFASTIPEEIKEVTKEEPKKMPNKFFNFLEDEGVSMNMTEEPEEESFEETFPEIPVIEDNTNNENATDKENNLNNDQNVIQEKNLNNSEEDNKKLEKSLEEKNESLEEIEMLDFYAPLEDNKEQIKNNTTTESEPDTMVNKLIQDLKTKNYKTLLTKEDNDNNMIYIINIEK